MPRWSTTFLVLATVAGLMGFFDGTSNWAGIAQIMFVIFLALLLISLVVGLVKNTDY